MRRNTLTARRARNAAVTWPGGRSRIERRRAIARGLDILVTRLANR